MTDICDTAEMDKVRIKRKILASAPPQEDKT